MKRFVAGLTALVFLLSFIAVAEARYYDPSTGRFISEDPIGFAGGDVNLSAYAKNNPINSIDPSGLDPIDPLTGKANPVLRCHVCPHDDPRENAIGALLVGAPLVGMLGYSAVYSVEAYNLIQGPLGTISMAALYSMANAPGPYTNVFTRLTQAPMAGRSLSVAIGNPALASAARGCGETYSAAIPTALIEQLKSVGLATASRTMMGDVVGEELRFNPAVTQYIIPFFKKQ